MQSRRPNICVGTLGILCLVMALGAGCGLTPWDDPGEKFSCTTDDDCIQGYVCVDGACEEWEESPPPVPPCEQSGNPSGDIDLDNDGYGKGEDRTNCPADKYQYDCDDTDPEVYPGAPELCDGKDNNCDNGATSGGHRADEFDCESNSDCGPEPDHLSSFLAYECIDGACVMRPLVQPESSDCEQILVTCDSSEQAFSYELEGRTYNASEVPSECR